MREPGPLFERYGVSDRGVIVDAQGIPQGVAWTGTNPPPIAACRLADLARCRG